MQKQSSQTHHFLALDGMRGVAALIVFWYHIFEGFAPSPLKQIINHGYLAVDFFFMLSGFVLAHAYDASAYKLGVRSFMKRRLIRLHPMVWIGTLLGLIAFYLQGCVQWSGEAVGATSIFVAVILHLLMIPVFPGQSADIRGLGEMYPLNGPAWSLFLEYVGSLLYIRTLHRLSNRRLTVMTIIAGIGLLLCSAIFNISGSGHLGFGWSLGGGGLGGGLLRLLFPFSMGMLLRRTFRPRPSRYAFLSATILLITFLSLPYIGNADTMWLNATYDVLVVALVFPTIILMVASAGGSNERDKEEGAKKRREQGIYRWLGEISYPFYIIHYPSMYLFYSWIWPEGEPFSPNKSFDLEIFGISLGIFACNLALAILISRYYDMPIRKYITKRLQK